MKLTYRGITYDYVPPQVKLGPVSNKGQYRGVPVTFRIVEDALVQPRRSLKYRGVAYTTGLPSTQAKKVTEPAIPLFPAKAPIVPLQERSRALMTEHRQSVRLRQQAMLTRLDEEVGLTANNEAHYESHV